MAEGFIYILINRAFQNDQYKIGMTTKSPHERAREISNATGVPRAFEVLYEQRVVDCNRAERILHQRLLQYRLTSNREFFQVPLKTAIRALEDVADEVGRVDDAPDRSSMSAAVDTTPLSIGELTAVPALSNKTRSKKVEMKVVTFEDHAAYITAPMQPVLYELRRRVLSLDARLEQEERCTSGQRIAYKIGQGRIFLETKVQRAAIVLHLAGADCPDPNGIVDDIPPSHGWRQLNKRLTIASAVDLEAAMPFIEAAYRVELPSR